MDTLALLATIIGPLALLGAYLYGRHQGWNTADTALRQKISEDLRKEFERQVKVQEEVRQAIERELLETQTEIEQLKEKAAEHEVKSRTSPDADSDGLSAERMQRLNDIKPNSSSGSTSRNNKSMRKSR